MTSATSELKRTVLVVDDDDIQRYAVGRLLEGAGFSVVQVASGQEAIETAINENPDVILLDVRLQDLNGFEVCRRIRRDPAGQRSAIVYYSGYSGPGTEHGGDDFLTYPVELEHMLMVIKGAIARRLMQQPKTAARL